jgi:hypothetical protein
MQTNIELAGKNVVVGLNWSLVSKKNPARKKDIRDACVASGLTLGVFVDGNSAESAAVGLCAKKVEYPSGAAMLAAANALAVKERAFGDTQSNNSWILIEKIKSGNSAGLYWMCAISDGVPVPGSDIIEDVTVTTARLADLVEILENIQIFSLDDEILEYVADASPTVRKGFADLTSEVVAGKSLRPQKIVGVPDWVYIVAASVGVLLIGGFGFSWWSEQQAQELKRKLANEQKEKMARAQQEEQLKQTRTYQQADQIARKTELDKIALSLSRNPHGTLSAWAQALDGLPLNHGGWAVSTVTCDTGACVVNLNRNEREGTNASLKEIIASAVISEDGRQASYTVPLNIAPSRSIPLDSLASWDDFSVKRGTSIQLLNMTGLVGASLGPRKELTYVPPATEAAVPVPGAAPAPPPPPKALGVMSGALSLTGKNIWQMSALEDYIQVNEFALTSMSVKFGGWQSDASWEASGEFFVKSSTPMQDAVGAPAGQPGMMAPNSGPMPPANQPLPIGAAGPK